MTDPETGHPTSAQCGQRPADVLHQLGVDHPPRSGLRALLAIHPRQRLRPGSCPLSSSSRIRVSVTRSRRASSSWRSTRSRWSRTACARSGLASSRDPISDSPSPSPPQGGDAVQAPYVGRRVQAPARLRALRGHEQPDRVVVVQRPDGQPDRRGQLADLDERLVLAHDGHRRSSRSVRFKGLGGGCRIKGFRPGRPVGFRDAPELHRL
jgi:hypothetical protein